MSGFKYLSSSDDEEVNIVPPPIKSEINSFDESKIKDNGYTTPEPPTRLSIYTKDDDQK